MACITALRSFSRDNAPLPPGNARYPTVVFMPGEGIKALTYHTLLEDLASHGWVVAAVDPPYNARGVRFPDGRVLGNPPTDERGWPQTRNREQTERYYRERIAHWCRDVSFVITQLAELDGGQRPFANRLDLKLGALRDASGARSTDDGGHVEEMRQIHGCMRPPRPGGPL